MTVQYASNAATIHPQPQAHLFYTMTAKVATNSKLVFEPVKVLLQASSGFAYKSQTQCQMR